MSSRPDSFDLLSADTPLTDPGLDRFGYAKLAENLAMALCKMPMTNGFVIGINAEWGLGKSTLLNYIEYFLKEQHNENERPVIVHFNPWWFSGQENLARHLFNEINSTLSSRIIKGVRGLREKFSYLADLASDAPVPGASGAKVVSKAIKPTQKDIIQTKKKIEEILRKHHRRILIMVDDIDRLTSEEIRQLFGVIKTVADLPNTIYLLAFDSEIVCRALDPQQSLSGEAYLEKIVQMPIKLPVPEPTALHQILMDHLATIFTGSNEFLLDKRLDISDRRYQNKWQYLIMHFISTPRHVIRLANALSVTYFAVKGEVYPIDFTIMEALRIFCPQAYDVIRKNSDMFTGIPLIPNLVFGIDSLQDKRAFHNKWLEGKVNENDRDVVKGLLAYCFPMLDAILNGTNLTIDDYSVFRRQNRVCDEHQFDRYFRFALSKSDITNAEIKSLLDLAANAFSFAEKLLNLSKQRIPNSTSPINQVLFRLQDYARSEVLLEHIGPMVYSLFSIGDDLLRFQCDEEMRDWVSSNDMQLRDLIRILLLRLEEPERFEIVSGAIKKSEAITTIAGKVLEFGIEHGKYGSDRSYPNALLTADHLNEVEKLALSKIRLAVEEDRLFQTPNLPRVMNYWVEWSPETARNWFAEHTEEDSALVSMLKKFSTKRLDDDGTERIYSYVRDLEKICVFNEIASHIDKILENTNVDNEKREFLAQIKEQWRRNNFE
jgi:predicted KAP-like P-loop ATPase